MRTAESLTDYLDDNFERLSAAKVYSLIQSTLATTELNDSAIRKVLDILTTVKIMSQSLQADSIDQQEQSLYQIVELLKQRDSWLRDGTFKRLAHGNPVHAKYLYELSKQMLVIEFLLTKDLINYADYEVLAEKLGFDVEISVNELGQVVLRRGEIKVAA